jgi:hypothetical protein
VSRLEYHLRSLQMNKNYEELIKFYQKETEIQNEKIKESVSK